MTAPDSPPTIFDLDWLDAHHASVRRRRDGASSCSGEVFAEINDLLVAYTVCYDAGDADGMTSLFTADGTYTSFLGTAGGHEQLRATFAGFLAKYAGAAHLMTNMTVEQVGPDRARARSYLQAFIQLLDGTAYTFVGSYQDELVRHGPTWLIAQRVVRDGLAFRVEPIDPSARLPPPSTAQ